MITNENITITEYSGFQHAYDFFNAELFAGHLPALLVTLQRAKGSRGYFSADRFLARAGTDRECTAHELALNPDTFDGRSDEEILSTLVHEMAHAWQQWFGTPSRTAYHNREWAAKMEELGLMPSNTGTPGGKRTGQKMTHYIIPGGPYARAYVKLKQHGYHLGWQSRRVDPQASAKRASKTKFTCGDCGQNAWAKADAVIICGSCECPMEAT
jgi:SprT-like family